MAKKTDIEIIDTPDVAQTPGWSDPSTKSEPFPMRADSPGAIRSKLSLSIPLDADGNPDWNKAQAKTVDRFKSILNSPSTRAQFNSESPAAITVDPDVARSFLATIFEAQAMFCSLRWKVTLNEAREICSLTKAESDQMVPRMQAVLGKRLPDFMAKWGDEIALGTMIGMASFARLNQMNALAAQKKPESKIEIPQPSKVNGAQPPVFVNANPLEAAHA